MSAASPQRQGVRPEAAIEPGDLLGTVYLGPLSVGIDGEGDTLYDDIESAANEKLEEILARF